MQNGHRDHARAPGCDAARATPEDGRTIPAAREGQRGFSLIEVLVATALTVIALVAIMDNCIRLQSLQRLDNEIGHVYRTCRAHLDEMRGMPLSQVRALDGTGFAVVGSTGTTPILTPVPGDPDGLPGHIVVLQERLAGGRVLYRIETSVQWLGASGRHAVAFTTLWGGKL